MIHGSHAHSVCFAVYEYFHSDWSFVVVAVFLPALASSSRSDFSRKRVFGCHTKRREQCGAYDREHT